MFRCRQLRFFHIEMTLMPGNLLIHPDRAEVPDRGQTATLGDLASRMLTLPTRLPDTFSHLRFLIVGVANELLQVHTPAQQLVVFFSEHALVDILRDFL